MPAPVNPKDELIKSVDVVTRARCGSLFAHGFSEQQIADTLMLQLEQVIAVKDTEEFKKKYSEVANEEIEKAVNIAEGWDMVEQGALVQVIETLKFNKDPRYALFAAKTANEAKRKQRAGGPAARVVDGSSQQSNVINLTLNKTYINNMTGGDNSKTIDGAIREVPANKKVADLPSPKQVENLLAPVRQVGSRELSELEKMFEIAGVFKDENPA